MAQDSSFWDDAQVVERPKVDTGSDYWDDATPVDALPDTTYDQESGKLISTPQGLSASEMQYGIKRDVSGAEVMFGQEEVGILDAVSAAGRNIRRTKFPDAAGALSESFAGDLEDGNSLLGKLSVISYMIFGAEGFEKFVGAHDSLKTASKEFTELARTNEKIYKTQRPSEENSSGPARFAYDVTNAAGDLGVASGLGVISRGKLVLPYFAALSKADIYREALASGEDHETADNISSALGLTIGVVEKIGFNSILGSMKGNTFVKAFIKGGLAEGATEIAQSTVEEVGMQSLGIRDKEMAQTVEDILYAGFVGKVVGGTTAGTGQAIKKTFVRDASKEAGLTDEQADNVQKYFDENVDKAGENIGEFLEKENSPITQVEKDPKLYYETVDKIQQGTLNVERKDLKPEQQKYYDAFAAEFAQITSDDAKAAKAAEVAAEKVAAKGVLTTLDKDILDIDNQIDAQQEKMAKNISDGKPTKAIDNKINSLLKKRSALDEQRGAILTAETDQQASQALRDRNVASVKVSEIRGAAKKAAAQAQNRTRVAFRKGIAAAKSDIKAGQETIIAAIRDSKLAAADKAKFITSIKNVKSSDDAQKKLPEITRRIDNMVEKQTRRDSIASIKKSVKEANSSGAISIGFTNQINEIMSAINLKGVSKKKADAAVATLQAAKNNPDIILPDSVFDSLEQIAKKNVSNITTQELVELSDKLDSLVSQGKLKFKLAEKKRQNQIEKDKAALTAATESISYPEGKRVSLLDSSNRSLVKRRFYDRYNKSRDWAKRVRIAKNPMDVLFDMLDGGKKYAGANSKIFKHRIDRSFQKYLQRKEAATREVKNLSDKLKLNTSQLNRIGVWAAMQQDGGREKLDAAGYTAAELDNLTLTKDEMQMYQLMRAKLDEQLPAIRKVMSTVYNKNVNEVKEYFPFLTDFEKMDSLEIQDMLGDDVPQLDQSSPKKSFTLSRTGGKQAIRVDAMNVFLSHIDNSSYLIDMASDLNVLSAVAKSESYIKSAGDLGSELVTDWLDLVARKGRAEGRSRTLDTFRSNVGAAILGFRISTVIVQPTALLDSAAHIGADYVRRGTQTIAGSKDARKFFMDNLPELRERIGDDPNYLDYGGSAVVKKAQRVGFWGLQRADLLTAASASAGAYIRSVESRGGKVDFANPDPIAIEEAQLFLRRGNSSPFQKDAPLLTSKGKFTGNPSIDSAIFQFQSFMLNRWSTIAHDLPVALRDRDAASSFNKATYLTLAMLAEPLLRYAPGVALALAMGADWDEATEDKEYGDDLIKSTLGNVPFVSPVMSAVDYGSSPVPISSATDAIWDRLSWASRSKSADKKAQHYAEAAILASGVAFGIPGTFVAEQQLRKALKE